MNKLRQVDYGPIHRYHQPEDDSFSLDTKDTVPYKLLQGDGYSGITQFKSPSVNSLNKKIVEIRPDEYHSKEVRIAVKAGKIALGALMVASVVPAAVYTPYYLADKRVKCLSKKQAQLEKAEKQFREGANKRIKQNYQPLRENEALRKENRLLLNYIKEHFEGEDREALAGEQVWKDRLNFRIGGQGIQTKESKKTLAAWFLPRKKEIKKLEKGVAQMEKQVKLAYSSSLSAYAAKGSLERENEAIREANKSLRDRISEAGRVLDMAYEML